MASTNSHPTEFVSGPNSRLRPLHTLLDCVPVIQPRRIVQRKRALETRRLNEIFYEPDLTVILTCDIEVSMGRIAKRAADKQAMENPFQRSVHSAYSSVQPNDKTIVLDTHKQTPEQIVRMVMGDCDIRVLHPRDRFRDTNGHLHGESGWVMIEQNRPVSVRSN